MIANGALAIDPELFPSTMEGYVFSEVSRKQGVRCHRIQLKADGAVHYYSETGAAASFGVSFSTLK